MLYNFFSEVVNCGVSLENAVFQRDHLFVTSLTNQKINFLKWLPQFPDLNPVENVWDHLDRAARKRLDKITKVDDLKMNNIRRNGEYSKGVYY